MKKPIRKRPKRVKAGRAHTRRADTRVKAHNKPTRSPWTSSDGEYMNEVAASLYLGLSVSRLQNMRSERIGPIFHKPMGRVHYTKRELKEYMESGVRISA